ncbi:MAG: HAD family hydrolase [Gammaproteobacteria bacterium]
MQALLFDLDGTLMDTAPDMAAALNRLLARRNRPTLPLSRIRPHVSHGSIGMLRIGFGKGPEEEGFEELKEEFLADYAEALCVQTQLFTGLESVLGHCQDIGLPWGIVTNKPGWLTEPLLEQFALPYEPGCVVCGDTLEHRKPHPAPLLHACRLLGVEPEHAVYIGDDERDMIAARDAGMRGVIALYGYVPETMNPSDWPAVHSLNSPGDLLAWLNVAVKSRDYGARP